MLSLYDLQLYSTEPLKDVHIVPFLLFGILVYSISSLLFESFHEE